MKEIIDTIHKTMYQFFDVCGEDEEISDRDELLLEVNKAICTNLKALEQKEPFINKPCVSEQACHEDKMKVLEKLRADLHATAEMHEDGDYYLRDEWIDEYFDKYMAESEDAE